MDLLEYEAKGLFREHGIPVPEGGLYEGEKVKVPGSNRVVVKSQIPAGKRKKYGGVKIVDREEARDTARDMLGSVVEGFNVQKVLIEEMVDIEREYYVSLSINRSGKNYHLVFSKDGGSGIEDVARENPGAVHVLDFYDIEGGMDGVGLEEGVSKIVRKMFSLMREEDALLVEINPLAVTPTGDLVATDAKVRLDENSFFRHERESDGGMEFVPLDGNIAVIGNGAGLVMATLDSIEHFGGEPADFLDIGGGADFETVREAMRLVMERKEVEGMFVNIFGGITRCDEVAEGIIEFVEEEGLGIPLVVRMVGTNQEEGREMLEDEGIHALDSMEECARKIVELSG